MTLSITTAAVVSIMMAETLGPPCQRGPRILAPTERGNKYCKQEHKWKRNKTITNNKYNRYIERVQISVLRFYQLDCENIFSKGQNREEIGKRGFFAKKTYDKRTNKQYWRTYCASFFFFQQPPPPRLLSVDKYLLSRFLAPSNIGLFTRWWLSTEALSSWERRSSGSEMGIRADKKKFTSQSVVYLCVCDILTNVFLYCRYM